MLSVLKICNSKFLGEEFCVSSVMNLAYKTIFATFTLKGKLEHGTSDPGGGTPIHYLYGYVPPKGVVILKLLI